MTIEQAKTLKKGDHVHFTGDGVCTQKAGPKGGVKTKIVDCRVSGEPKTWVNSPGRVKVPIKHGLYSNGYLDQDNLEYFHLPDDCPLLTEPAAHPTGTVIHSRSE